MNKKDEICLYLDEAINACEVSLRDNSYKLYFDRYQKLLDKVKRIKDAVITDQLYTEISDLGIVKMIIENDPKELIDAVLKVNLFFRKNYSSVL